MTGRKLLFHFVPTSSVEVEERSVGGHERASAISPLALFIYLQILLVLFAGLYFIRTFAPHILGTASFGAGEIIALTNAKRAENNLSPLSVNEALAQAASAKAADMLANDYWAHNSPSGKTPWSFITAAGYRYVFAGENLARDFNDAVSAVNAWMNSPSHRSNLLDSNFKEIGVVVVDGKLGGTDGSLVVQMFGAGISQAPVQLAQPSPSPQPPPVAQASPQGLPTSSPEVTPAPAIAQVPPGQAGPQAQATVLATKQFSIAKGASLALVGFIFLLFALEAIIVTRNENMHLRGGVIAHLGLLGFVLLAVWYSVQGAII